MFLVNSFNHLGNPLLLLLPNSIIRFRFFASCYAQWHWYNVWFSFTTWPVYSACLWYIPNHDRGKHSTECRNGLYRARKKNTQNFILGSNTHKSLSFASYCFIESLIRHVHMDGHLFKIQKPALVQKKVLQITLKSISKEMGRECKLISVVWGHTICKARVLHEGVLRMIEQKWSDRKQNSFVADFSWPFTRVILISYNAIFQGKKPTTRFPSESPFFSSLGNTDKAILYYIYIYMEAAFHCNWTHICT